MNQFKREIFKKLSFPIQDLYSVLHVFKPPSPFLYTYLTNYNIPDLKLDWEMCRAGHKSLSLYLFIGPPT